MISSGSPQVFIPFGREHFALHPGDPQLSPPSGFVPNTVTHTDAGEDILDAIRDFSITEHDAKKGNAREEWKLRPNPNSRNIPCDEELYFIRNTAIWSRGTDKSSRQVLMSFTVDQPIEHVLWCTFCVCLEPPIGQVLKPKVLKDGDNLPSVCILSLSKLSVFLTRGEEFTVPLPFQIAGVWPMKYGLLFERKVSQAAAAPTQRQVDMLPVLFSLIHPLDEITPVVQHSSSGSIGYVTSQNELVVHAFEDPSLVVTYNKQLGVHTVWKLRLAKAEEGLFAVHGLETSFNIHHNQLLQHATGSPAIFATPSTLSRFNLSPQVASGQGSSSSFRGLSSRTASPLLRSRPQSPGLSSLTHMATISRSQSPVASYHSLYGYSPPSPSRCSAAIQRTPVSLHGSVYTDLSESREPLMPNICLESLWVEPKLSAFRDCTLSGQASKVFFTADTYNQRFLCLLVPSYSQLRCIRVDETNDQRQLIFGSITPIAAQDAAGLEGSSLMVVLDLTGSLIIYSGIIKICKVHVPLSTNSLYHKLNLTHTVAPTSILTHDSIVTSSRPSSALAAHFDEDVHLLSPVPADANMSTCSIAESSFVDKSHPEIASIISLCDAVQNKISVKYSNGELHRINIPHLKTSCIVDNALEAFRYVLPKDVGLQVFSKWYTIGHAPGSDVTTPLHQWTMFVSFLFGIMGYDVEHINMLHPLESEQCSVEVVAKKFKPSDRGSDEDWEYLQRSHHHRVQNQDVNTGLEFTNAKQCNVPFRSCINTEALLFMHIPTVMYCLHLLYEELKLNKLHWIFLPHIAEMLYFLARDLRLTPYVDYYWRDFPNVTKYDEYSSQINDETLKHISFPSFMTSEPPSIFQWLEDVQLGKDSGAFPYIPLISKRTRVIAILYTVLNRRLRSQMPPLWEKCIQPLISSGQRVTFSDDDNCHLRKVDSTSSTPWEAVVMVMALSDVKSSDLDSFPVGVALPLRDAIGKCRKKPPSNWPAEAYILIGREDLAAQLCSPQVTLPATSTVAENKVPVVSENKKPVVIKDDDDGMEHMDQELLQLHFSRDLRVQEVRRLLQSSKPARIALVQRPEVSDHEFIEEQERHLYSICIRVMSLPIGRGMFTLRTTKPVVTEAVPIPKLCLTGRAPPRNTMIDLTHIDVPANMNLWPLFHNGVAAGLCIAPNASEIDSTWIVYNKPKGNAELPTEHAGFLMALGLNGHLKNLATMNIYDYAVKGHEMTSVGLLLGIAAAKRGTMDLAATKLLSIHIEALLPPTSTELDIPHVVQVAAVLGIGLVYQGTAHRHMAEVLLSEIGRPPGPEMENSTDRESYSLAAGLALGLVTLGKGSNVAGLSDLGMADQLFHYMVGGPKRLMSGAMHEKYKSASYQIKEGDGINVDVTSPGATLALGFMFFGTHDKTVAEWMTAPDTQYLLDFVRPDFLLLRTLSKGLILWDEVVPSSTWVESHVPEIISSAAVLREQQNFYVDIETLSQAYCNIIAGACLVLGMRFAGSANEDAYNTLLKYARTFIGLLGKSASEQAGRCTVENCMNVVVLSLAAVMAGTGDLEVLRICRHLHNRIGQSHSHVLYGSHMATHMAIGLLFLGGGRYTLSTTKSAIAAMICAFFPKFPTHSNDNRYHLQAFRHLYVLAAEPRLIIPRDIDTGLACYTHFAVTFKATKWYDETTLILKAPFLLPQLGLLKKVSINDPRYWPVTFAVNKNWDTFISLLEKDGTIYVKKRTGCLSYNDDPNGFRSLLAQSLVEDKSGKWTAKPKAIKALTSDPTVQVVLDLFLGSSAGNNKEESVGQQLLSHLVYECVTQEKLDALPSLISLMQIDTSKVVSTMDLWQVRLITAFCSSWSESNLNSHQMVNKEAFVALCSKLDKHCEEWSTNFTDALADYWKNTALHKLTPSLIPFLIRYQVPPPHKAALVISSTDLSSCLPLLCVQLAPLKFPNLTVLKLHQHLSYLLN